MAQDSYLWTTGATGDGATAYTQAKCIRWQRQTFCGADNEGVLKDYLNELATTGTSSPVATNTGGAYVYGFPYNNTASVDTAVPTPSGNTRIDRIVLRAGWSAQTVRITRIAGTEGSGTPPAMTQTDGTTWDIPLYQASITTGGVITLTDEREFLHPNIAVDGDMLDDDAVDSQHYTDGSIDTVHVDDLQITLAKLAADSVDDTKAGNRMPQFYRRQGGHASNWDVVGTTNYTPTTVRMCCGCTEVTCTDSASSNTVNLPFSFSYKPHVMLSLGPIDVSPGPVAIDIWVTDAAVNSFAVNHRRHAGSNSDITVYWLAIGPE